MNSILSLLGNQRVQSSNSQGIIERYRNFANICNDPNKELNRLLESGKVTKEQVNYANDIVKLITGKSAL